MITIVNRNSNNVTALLYKTNSLLRMEYTEPVLHPICKLSHGDIIFVSLKVKNLAVIIAFSVMMVLYDQSPHLVNDYVISAC